MAEQLPDEPTPPEGRLVIYRDGATRLQVRLDGQTVWLTQRQLADLYQVTVPTINEHLKNIYGEVELDRVPTIAQCNKSATQQRKKIPRSLRGDLASFFSFCWARSRSSSFVVTLQPSVVAGAGRGGSSPVVT
jgi:hypothetical protein